ncbi:MAG: phosphoribosylaminoimidazolesuccinocarboxamide synthase [Bacteroidia bacterium]|nr:phosphoribosylaminoimidazolesuccinocarboxamide synthase [Bacteroidia bacterium]
MNAFQQTSYQFPRQTAFYRGKVRDVYEIEEQVLVLIASDRISAFDVILPAPIPHKGQVLNQTAAYFLNSLKNIVPNHFLVSPDPNVTLALKCNPFPVEVVVRGYLCGHAWRVYAAGERTLCGNKLPDGLRENDPFPEPIITPAIKSKFGHDEDISEYEILKSKLLDEEDWFPIRHYALQLYHEGTKSAEKQGLILADTKYEFGTFEDKILLIDEVHTPDSSRYFWADGFSERQQAGESQMHLSKEFVREWLLSQGFHGQEGASPPPMSSEIITEIRQRYIQLYEQITGQHFEPRNYSASTEQELFEKTVQTLLDMGLKV